MSIEQEFDIRYTEKGDEPHVVSWLQPEEDRLHYPISSDESALFFAKNMVGFSRFKASLTGIYEKTPIAIATLYLMPYQKLAHHAMFYILVDPRYRRKGIGRSMLKNLAHLAKTRFALEHIHCEVFSGSPLLFLLEKEGFTRFITQENYVKQDDKYLARTLWRKSLG